jgi:hypothetical protein
VQLFLANFVHQGIVFENIPQSKTGDRFRFRKARSLLAVSGANAFGEEEGGQRYFRLLKFLKRMKPSWVYNPTILFLGHIGNLPTNFIFYALATLPRSRQTPSQSPKALNNILYIDG